MFPELGQNVHQNKMSRNVYIVFSFLVVSRKQYVHFYNTYIFALKFRFSFLKTWIIHVYVSQLQKTKNCSYWQFSWTWIQVYIFWVWNDSNVFFFAKSMEKSTCFDFTFAQHGAFLILIDFVPEYLVTRTVL